MLDRIVDLVDELTRPKKTRERQMRWDEARHRLRPITHVEEHASLLEQLAAAVEPSAGRGNAGGYESKPTARLDAIDVLARIDSESVRWVKWATREDPRPDTASNLRLVASAAATLDVERLGDLARDVTRWWAASRVTTGWDSPAWEPNATCPLCGHLGGLRVRVAPLAGWCRECGEAWDESTIGLLGEHVRAVTGDTQADQPARNHEGVA